MVPGRFLACLPAASFAALVAVMAYVGALPPGEAALAALAAAAALLPSGWLAPGGWRRRAAEAAVLPAAFALVMAADPTLRRMMLPPLLALAALAAAAAALPRTAGRGRMVVSVALALAVRTATGLGLAGEPAWRVALVVLAVVAVAAAVARVLEGRAALLVALLAGAAPLERVPGAVLAGAALAAVLIATRAPRAELGGRLAGGWGAAALALGLLLASLAPWGGFAAGRLFPAAGWLAAAAGGLALVATPLLPPALAGAAWLGVAAFLGPPQPPPPDRAGFELTAANPEARLPVSEGGLYLVEVSLANAAGLPQGTVVATVRDAGRDVPIRAGIDAAEWAHERADVRRAVAHSLPAVAVWRPSGFGRSALWGVAGRIAGELPAGARPRLLRAPGLPPAVVVSVATAGTSRPTPPRDWPLPAWILAAAAAVALVQLAAGTWRSPFAPVPWALLAVLALADRIPVAPLGVLAERHAVDLALAALLAAWLPAAHAWLRRGRVFLAAAALLVPLALATPHLTPSLYGDEPFHLIVLDSLAHDHDLDLSNNYDLQHHPYNRIYMTGKIFLHSPALAFLLLPGYLAGGRAGALVVLALAGAALVAVLVRRARALGVRSRRLALLPLGLLLTYPLATFSTQIWVELVGALAAAGCLVLLARPVPRRIAVTAVTALGIAVKTRLGLILSPLALVAWWPRRLRTREVAVSGAVLALATAAALAVEALFLGYPLGMRRLPDLLPHDLRQPLITLGGLAFDPAGGLLFAAPLGLVALAGVPLLWRRGGWGERALLIGGALTLAALLPSQEWYGGGAPPARYLVPLLPAFALALACLPRAPGLVALAGFALPPSLLTWWVYVTRPHLTVNPGDGGWWLADALASRFAADARRLMPSFLRPGPATVVVPLLVAAAALAVVLAACRFPRLGRGLARSAVAFALVAAAAILIVLTQRTDRVVELEDPQVTKIGGSLQPPPGTYSRFLYPNGWRLRDGDGIEAPLNLPAHARVRLEGWLEGPAQRGAEFAVSWDGAAPVGMRVAAVAPGGVTLPGVPAAGRHRLRILLEAPAGGEAVLDRLVVAP